MMGKQLKTGATSVILRTVAERVPAGASESLRGSLRRVTWEERRSDRAKARGFRTASREDHATVSELRTEVPAAYLLADQARLEQMQAIGLYLKCGEPTQVAEKTGIPLRTLQRWFAKMLEFGAVYLSDKVKRARQRLVRERNEFESRLGVARQQCAEICNPEDRLGYRYECDSLGCLACPLRAFRWD